MQSIENNGRLFLHLHFFVIALVCLIAAILGGSFWLLGRGSSEKNGAVQAKKAWSNGSSERFVELANSRYDYKNGLVVRHYCAETGLKLHVTRDVNVPYIDSYNKTTEHLMNVRGLSSVMKSKIVTDNDLITASLHNRTSLISNFPASLLSGNIKIFKTKNGIRVRNRYDRLILTLDDVDGVVSVVELENQPFCFLRVDEDLFVFTASGQLIVEYYSFRASGRRP